MGELLFENIAVSVLSSLKRSRDDGEAPQVPYNLLASGKQRSKVIRMGHSANGKPLMILLKPVDASDIQELAERTRVVIVETATGYDNNLFTLNEATQKINKQLAQLIKAGFMKLSEYTGLPELVQINPEEIAFTGLVPLKTSCFTCKRARECSHSFKFSSLLPSGYVCDRCYCRIASWASLYGLARHLMCKAARGKDAARGNLDV